MHLLGWCSSGLIDTVLSFGGLLLVRIILRRRCSSPISCPVSNDRFCLPPSTTYYCNVWACIPPSPITECFRTRPLFELLQFTPRLLMKTLNFTLISTSFKLFLPNCPAPTYSFCGPFSDHANATNDPLDCSVIRKMIRGDAVANLPNIFWKILLCRSQHAGWRRLLWP